MVFQHHQLILRYPALQNVLMGRLGYHPFWRTLFPLAKSERRIPLECLDRVGLLHKALERAENLSGGERQRVGIARALAQQPRLILADEPVASLDPGTAHKILGLLHQVCKEDGITAVVSLHQVELARAYADRIIGLNRGRVVFDGTPGELRPEVCGHIYAPLLADHDEVHPATNRSPRRSMLFTQEMPDDPHALPGGFLFSCPLWMQRLATRFEREYRPQSLEGGPAAG
jgi:phosphonate transport system ATP-binding protein